jgi:carbon monoxide dehydrogenase subunit G
MRIQQSFTVDAPPDQVFAYLLDVNQVAGCIKGAQLTEAVDSKTFRGTLRVKVGAIQVTYQGTARLVEVEEHDDSSATARVEGDAREVGGQGSVRGTLAITVTGQAEGGSKVDLDSEFTVTGRVAQFGRGVMEDVSRRMVGEMADCIRANLQRSQAGQAS